MGSVSTSDVTISNATDSVGPESVVPKLEPHLDGYDSPSASSLDQDHDGEAAPDKLPTDPAPIPKRKGGRKPVSHICPCTDVELTLVRYMQHQKNANNGTVKHRQLFESVEQNTSSSWKRLSSIMKTHCRPFSKAIVRLLTNA